MSNSILPAETARAPPFRQHPVSIHSREVGNAHLFELQHFPCSLFSPPYSHVYPLTNPDGPGNILLFDIAITWNNESLGNYSATPTCGIFNPFHFPYSHLLHLVSTDTDSLELCTHLGKHCNTYCGISNPNFFPYASLFYTNIICTDFAAYQTRPNQETVIRADQKQKSWPIRPDGPGHIIRVDTIRANKNSCLRGPQLSFHTQSSYPLRPSRPPTRRHLIPSPLSHGGSNGLHDNWFYHSTRYVPSSAKLWWQQLCLSQPTNDNAAYEHWPSMRGPHTLAADDDEATVQTNVHTNTAQNSVQSLLGKCSTTTPQIASPIKLTIDPSFTLHSYDLSSSQMHTLFQCFGLPHCTIDDDILDWVLRLHNNPQCTGIFYYDYHWYPYQKTPTFLQVVLPSNTDGFIPRLLLTLQTTSTSTSPLLTYFSPPTPRGLCGLTALSLLHHWISSAPCNTTTDQALQDPSNFCNSFGTLPMVSLRNGRFAWSSSQALQQLHSLYTGFLAYTSKHFVFGPKGGMESPTPNIVITPEPNLPTDRIIHVSLSNIPMPITPITYLLQFDTPELSHETNVVLLAQSQIIYYHFDHSYHMHLYQVRPGTTFETYWRDQYPLLTPDTIESILLWSTFTNQWHTITFAQLNDEANICHIRIKLRTRRITVDFPIARKTFSIEITPIWNTTHLTKLLYSLLGFTGLLTTLTLEQGRQPVNQLHQLWRGFQHFTLSLTIAKAFTDIPANPRQLPQQRIHYCTCGTWCATTQSLTRRAFETLGILSIEYCLFRHPTTNHLYLLPICSTTTPYHIHARYLAYDDSHWIPIVNGTLVSMTIPLYTQGIILYP